MKRLLCTVVLIALASAAGGCVFYADDDDCAAPDYWLGYRNPDTGVCENWGGGGGGCYGALEGAQDVQALPDWASCPGACEGLDESTCLATPGCRGSYFQEECPPDTDCDGPFGTRFQECWGTAPTGPVQGACEGLDAQECSRHDDCIAVYGANWEYGGQAFSYCAPEPTVTPGCELVDCAPGYHCELQCYPCDGADPDDPICDPYCEPICVPDAPTCDDGTVCPEGEQCVTVCAGGDCLPDEPCPPKECWSECVPDDVPDPGTCEGDVWCDSLPPTCPAGTTPGILNGCWSGYCIPLTDCGPGEPGSCYGEVLCDMATPACPEGTTPGVLDGCYTGYCIPIWQCETQVVCEALGEADCVARPDCAPVYSGYGCTCDPDGTCTCEDWVYERCEAGGGEPVPL
jgi:hypothetical protein